MILEEVKAFILTLVKEEYEIIESQLSLNTEEEHYNKVKAFVERNYGTGFSSYIKNSLGVKVFPSEYLSLDEIQSKLSRIVERKVFFIEHRKEVKWGSEAYAETDEAFFCYLGGNDTSFSVVNDFTKVYVLGLQKGNFKISAKMFLDVDLYQEKKKLKWTKLDNKVKTIVLQNGWGKVIEVLKIEAPTGRQEFIDYYDNL